jgi:hypothetical protein
MLHPLTILKEYREALKLPCYLPRSPFLQSHRETNHMNLTAQENKRANIPRLLSQHHVDADRSSWEKPRVSAQYFALNVIKRFWRD